MQNLEWYLADLKSTGKNTIETVEKSLTDMFIRLVRIYPCLITMSLKRPFVPKSDVKQRFTTTLLENISVDTKHNFLS